MAIAYPPKGQSAAEAAAAPSKAYTPLRLGPQELFPGPKEYSTC